MAEIGVLLTNLGTPEAPTKKAVCCYLAEFLADPMVIDLKPRWLWWLVLHGIILRIRPKHVAHSYRQIWDVNTGSPLRYISNEQCVKLAELLGGNYKVMLGMRYGIPSISAAVAKLHGCKAIVIVPMYPQYSTTTTLSTLKAVQACGYQGKLEMIESYFDLPGYIDALASSITNHWGEHGNSECLVFSFHGLPERYVKEKKDPYYQQCLKTVELVVAKLNLPDSAYRIAFQSRVGRGEWLKPYVDKVVVDLAKQGVKNIAVIAPGFAADCLETLEELDIRLRHTFLNNGGEEFHYISALNDNESLITTLADKILKV